MTESNPDFTAEARGILHLNGCHQRTAGYNEAKEGKELDMDEMEELEAITLRELTQAHLTAVREARKQTASDIFELAHQFARDDETMVGAEELRNYHYYNAIAQIGEFDGR